MVILKQTHLRMATKKKIKKGERIEKILSEDGKYIVADKNYTKGTTTYYVRGRQAKFLNKIIFDGYLGIPIGFYVSKEGWGFPAHTKGYFFLETLNNVIPLGKSVELIISRDSNNAYREYAHKVSVKIKAIDFKRFIERLRVFNQRSNDEAREIVSSYLSSRFPSKIKISTRDYDSYKSGEVAEILNKKGISSKLDEEDLNAIFNFFPKVFESAIQGRKGVLKDLKIRLAKEGKRITDKIFLDEVIKEFEERIEKKTAKEEDWQKFLKEKVFPFLTGYIKVIDKENIGVDISYPDFVLVDIYGFADIFEIKTHATQLLSYDSSHENYYWSPNVAQAISQVENYVDTIRESEAPYVKKVRRKYQIDLTVNRPKGFVIAGTYSQLDSEKAKDDFRKLRGSHKNVEFILYDELLSSLKSIQSKLESSENTE